PPVGDPNYKALRGPIAIGGFGEEAGALKLDETFGLHPSLAKVHELAMKGQARIVPAVATPDRERSHFEAQDVLENGETTPYQVESGWLNRALSAMDGKPRALSIGATAPLILRGPVEASSWSPGGEASRDPRLPGILQHLYAADPLLGPALASGLSTEAMAKLANAEAQKSDQMALAPTMAADPREAAAGPALKPYMRAGLPQATRLGATLAGFMVQPQGAQVAAVSIDGFDTHANEGAATGQLAARIAYLDAFLDGLASGMGQSWKSTVVVAATEFGRTARVNGTLGTDHATGSTALLLGGALKAGGIIGDWPTLAQNRLFQDRDTWPALDMRSLFKGVLRDHLGIEKAALDSRVFPSSAAAAPVSGLV
ncbi:MAG: DUF1501 domain-containing protein, partial [Caulobacteraceae bacterium]